MSRPALPSPMLSCALVAACATAAVACGGGGYETNCYLGNDAQLLRSPRSRFLAELRRALPRRKAPFKAQWSKGGPSAQDYTRQRGEEDVLAALKASGVPEPTRNRILKGYLAVRGAVCDYANELASHRLRARWMSEKQRAAVKPPALRPPRMPAGLPEQFAHYLRGAIAWHKGDPRTARRHWMRVLRLPAAERRDRTVWAAYMLGRSYVGHSADRATQWLAAVRSLVAKGFGDSTGLAAASLGWEARVELDRKNYRQAVRLYAQQLACGDKSATASLRICANRLIQARGEALAGAARDPLTRGVVTAYLVAGPHSCWIDCGRSGAAHVETWLEAVEGARARNIRGAERLAWAAYRTGLMRQAQRWVDRAPKEDMIACWLRAKLLLRAGKLEDAAEQLAHAFRRARAPVTSGEDGLSPREQEADRRVTALAEDLASLHLSRKQYVRALDLLVAHDRCLPVAYIAERILTTEELTDYVKTRRNDRTRDWVRYLLARRLVRQGRWKDARAYFDKETRSRLDAYVRAIRKGNDTRAGRADRAESFWTAARMARDSGDQLMGYGTTSVQPQRDGKVRPWEEFARTARSQLFTVAPASKDEHRRVAGHRPKPPDRWHPVYEAVSHAWQACELMPDNDERTAQRLCEAGTWIKYLDPNAADRFYKALVLRCGNTKLGRQADRLRWFPRIQADPTR